MTQTDTAPALLTLDTLLAHWQGHRRLTRRVIEAFPEDQLFSFSIGGMRPFGAMVWELCTVGTLTLSGLLSGEWPMPKWGEGTPSDRATLLRAWDDLTARLDHDFARIPAGMFAQKHKLPWLETSGWDMLLYTIDNEIHHRGEGYVYLRSLGITPPPFPER
ncbi:DinB family protein [Deinococcus sp.]|uniref:DinB family protein n=1 Tax=Deinococcus sp. TaxID=47478 RepID=UPI003CC5550B